MGQHSRCPQWALFSSSAFQKVSKYLRREKHGMLVRCSRVAARASVSYYLDCSSGEIPPRLRVHSLGLQSLSSSKPPPARTRLSHHSRGEAGGQGPQDPVSSLNQHPFCWVSALAVTYFHQHLRWQPLFTRSVHGHPQTPASASPGSESFFLLLRGQSPGEV